jgi:GTP cyclohydrolase II
VPSSSPHAILEVERAASDLRRGQAVLLTQNGKPPLRVRSGEHEPNAPFTADADHPAVQLMKHAGLLPHAVVEELKDSEDDLLRVSAEAIARYPAALAESLEKVSEATVPLKGADKARVIAFRPRFGHEEHLAVIIGEPEKQKAPLVRIHSSCVTGDVFGSLRCDCGPQLQRAVEEIQASGGGAIIYLSQEGRGIGIANKLRAYALQDKGMDTVEANEALGFAPDERNFALAGRILKEIGLKRVTLLTNNPEKVAALGTYGIAVEKRLSLVTPSNPYNARYLDTKVTKLGHQF